MGCYFIILPVAEVARVSTYARNWVHWTRFVSQETEFIGLNFYTYKSSPLNSVSMYKKRVQWTRFPSLINLISQHHQSHPIASTVTWAYPKSSLEDLIFMNGPQPSTCCHGSLLGPVFLLTVGSHSFSSIFSSKTQLYILFETTFLNSYMHSQNTHLTQHSQVMFLQYYDYLLVFFLKKI